MHRPVAYEIRDRVKTGVPAILLALGTMPGVRAEAIGLSVGQPVPGPLPGPRLFANVIGGAGGLRDDGPQAAAARRDEARPDEDALATTARNLAFGESPIRRDPRDPGMPPNPKKKGDLQTFIDEVNKLSDNGKVPPVRQGEVRRPAEVRRRFRLHSAASRSTATGAETEWNLEEAPDLAPLVEAQKKSLRDRRHQQAAQYIPFAGRSSGTRSSRAAP